MVATLESRLEAARAEAASARAEANAAMQESASLGAAAAERTKKFSLLQVRRPCFCFYFCYFWCCCC